jgi:hypothetical protein
MSDDCFQRLSVSVVRVLSLVFRFAVASSPITA